MKFLKWVITGCFWFIVIGVVFALSRADGAAAVQGSAGFLVILVIAGAIYGLVVGFRKLFPGRSSSR